MEKQESPLDMEEFTNRLEKKIKDINPSDFRFYNIARIPLLAKHTFNFSEECEICKNNSSILEELINSLPDCLNDFKERKLFEKNRDLVSKHLQKKHNIRFVNYHYSLYTFAGLLTGTLIGVLIQIFFQHRIWTILAIAGAFAGAIYGKRLEVKKRKENRLM